MASKRSARSSPLATRPEVALTARAVVTALAALANPERAVHSAGFFKTAPGQYGHGDQFLGIAVPELRRVVRQFRGLELAEIDQLLASAIHEHRLAALMVLVDRYERGDAAERQRCYDFYGRKLARVNQWDLVDSTAHQIVGQHLLTRDRRPLYRWAKSASLWERRVAMVATYAFIHAGEAADTFALARLLIDDQEDLIHKATGWMLREVGKRVSEDDLRGFLTTHAAHLPRTALRYAIERFSPTERARWLKHK